MSSGWAIGSLALATVVTILVVLAIVIWSIRRHRDPRLKIESECGIEELLPTLAGLSLGSVVGGNAVEILENGRFWDVLEERIGKARKSIHYEMFLWKEGKLDLDGMITRRIKLDEINDAFAAMQRGEVIRQVISF